MIVPGSSFIFGEVCNDPTCDPYWDNVVLAMHMDGADNGTTFTDEKGKTVTRFGNTVTKTGVKKFGTASAYFDGTDDYLTVPHHTDLNIETTAQFTIDIWVYPSSIGTIQRLLEKRLDITFTGYGLRLDASGAITFYFTAASVVTSTSLLVQNTWTHIAVVRESTSILKIYINGILSGTNSSAINGTLSTVELRIATNHLYTEDFNGYIDDLRITKGVARYTSNFTPPCRAFPNSVC